nr:hypothetical protein [Tanacetum cinerariifolium]
MITTFESCLYYIATIRNELFYLKKKTEFDLWYENSESVDSSVSSKDEIEEEDDDLEYFDTFLTIEELGYHE